MSGSLSFFRISPPPQRVERVGRGCMRCLKVEMERLFVLN